MKFDLSKFVMRTLHSMMANGEDEYKIRQYALKYYERGILTEENLAVVDNWFIEPTENTSEEDINNEE